MNALIGSANPVARTEDDVLTSLEALSTSLVEDTEAVKQELIALRKRNAELLSMLQALVAVFDPEGLTDAEQEGLRLAAALVRKCEPNDTRAKAEAQ